MATLALISCNYAVKILDCGQPVLSPNVSAVSTTGTTEGDTVTLQCEDGLFPEIPVLFTCNSAGVWSPNPTLSLYHKCYKKLIMTPIGT